MNKKNLLASGAACMLLVAALAIPASAHGGHGGRATTTAYPVCAVESCDLTGQHDHDGVTYCAPRTDRAGCGHGQGRGRHC